MSDAKLAEAAKERAGKDVIRGERRVVPLSNVEASCPFCGRYWRVYNRNGSGQLGFIISAGDNHAFTCSQATPEERRAIARLDEKRWARNPPANTIRNDANHPGFGGVDFRKS